METRRERRLVARSGRWSEERRTAGRAAAAARQTAGHRWSTQAVRLLVRPGSPAAAESRPRELPALGSRTSAAEPRRRGIEQATAGLFSAVAAVARVVVAVVNAAGERVAVVAEVEECWESPCSLHRSRTAAIAVVAAATPAEEGTPVASPWAGAWARQGRTARSEHPLRVSARKPMASAACCAGPFGRSQLAAEWHRRHRARGWGQRRCHVWAAASVAGPRRPPHARSARRGTGRGGRPPQPPACARHTRDRRLL